MGMVKFSSLLPCLMSDLVETPKSWFCHHVAHLLVHLYGVCYMKESVHSFGDLNLKRSCLDQFSPL